MGGFSREVGLQVQVDGALEVSLALLHLTSLPVLPCVRQPLVIVPDQAVQLWVALGVFTMESGVVLRCVSVPMCLCGVSDLGLSQSDALFPHVELLVHVYCFIDGVLEKHRKQLVRHVTRSC